MKNLRQNVSVLVVVVCFLGFGSASAIGKAQTKSSAKTTITTKSKKPPMNTKATSKTSATPQKTKESVNLNSKAKQGISKKEKNAGKTSGGTNSKSETAKLTTKQATKTTPKSKPKSVETPQIIVSVTSARVRSEPDTKSNNVKTLNVGTILPVLDTNSGWYKVKFSDDKSGWISKTVSMDFDSAQIGVIYQSIVEKYFKGKEMNFADASQIYNFLKTIPNGISDESAANLNFKRLLALSIALKKIPLENLDENSYKSFVKTNEKEIAYSDPAGQYYVRSDAFWQLHNKYKNFPIGEEIAWQAANNPLPGECEGYVNCYLYELRVTDGEYLNFYPGGKYSKKALQDIISLLEPLVADLKDKKIYTAATDISDRAEFNRYLVQLRTIISRIPHLEKSKALQQINQLGEGYR